MKIKPIATLVQSVTLISSLLLSGCSQAAENNHSTANTSEVATTITSVESSDFELNWTNKDSEEFADYYQKTTGREKTLNTYIRQFGFDNAVQQLFTDFVNDKYNQSFNYVPFSKVNYLYDYLIAKEQSFVFHNNYDAFSEMFLNEEYSYNSLFKNKVIYSYLIANNIPLGYRISVEQSKAILGEKIYLNHGTYKYFYNNRQLGNYPASYKYTSIELYHIITMYNARISDLCNDERIADFNLFSTDPKYSEDAKKAVEIYNGYLKKYYGENAFQVGQVPTREQYKSIFGEEPLDLSYIPGAIVK